EVAVAAEPIQPMDQPFVVPVDHGCKGISVARIEGPIRATSLPAYMHISTLPPCRRRATTLPLGTTRRSAKRSTKDHAGGARFFPEGHFPAFACPSGTAVSYGRRSFPVSHR